MWDGEGRGPSPTVSAAAADGWGGGDRAEGSGARLTEGRRAASREARARPRPGEVAPRSLDGWLPLLTSRGAPGAPGWKGGARRR